MSKFFDELMESVQQMNEILRGEREPSREFHVDALQVKSLDSSWSRFPDCPHSIKRGQSPSPSTLKVKRAARSNDRTLITRENRDE